MEREAPAAIFRGKGNMALIGRRHGGRVGEEGICGKSISSMWVILCFLRVEGGNNAKRRFEKYKQRTKFDVG